MPEDGEVGVYLVADYYDIMLITDVGKALKSLFAPCYSSRIMRITEYEHLRSVYYREEIIEVHLIEILAICLYQLVFHRASAVSLSGRLFCQNHNS